MATRNPFRPLSAPERTLWREVYVAALKGLVVAHDGGTLQRRAIRAEAIAYANGAITDFRRNVTRVA